MNIKGFDSNFIEELKGRNDLVDVASQYVPSLTKKGGSYWGNCPFHLEKTPSFSINREQGFYKCFGCGVGGDVITFIMNIESLTFMEAIYHLADRAGMQVPKLSDTDDHRELKEKRERLYSLLRDAARIYHNNLSKPCASAANEYISKRQISPASVIKFGLGYSDGYNSIIDELKEKGYSKKEMVEAGVIQEREGKFFDAMAGRLVFPIIDANNNVIAFGGRVLGKTDFAKYKNTGDTIAFTKNRTLYGLNYIKKLRLKEKVKDLIMVEGYMDTLALIQAGVKNVVASMGTSLTEEQARLTAKYVDEVYICYDGDSAGQAATLRGLEILKSHGLKVKVITLPNGEDPDEIIKRLGVEGFLDCKKAAVELTEYKLRRLKEKSDFDSTDGRVNYANAAAEIISRLDTDSEKEAYAEYVSKATGIKMQAVMKQVELNSKKSVSEEISTRQVDATDANIQAARFILRQCLYGVKKWENISDLMPNDGLRAVADYLNECALRGDSADLGMVYHILSAEDADAIINYDITCYGGSEDVAYNDCVKQLKKEARDKAIAKLQKEYTASTSDEERTSIMKRIAELTVVKK